MFPILSAIAAIWVITTISLWASSIFSTRLVSAMILCVTSFIYAGSSFRGNTFIDLLPEILVAIFVYFIARIGYAKNSVLIAYGFLIHGVWDILHFNGLLVKTEIQCVVPMYYFVIDFILGIYLLLFFTYRKIKLIEKFFAG